MLAQSIAPGYHRGMNLRNLHARLSKDERKALAVAADIKPEYLYQLASGFKANPSMRTCAALVAHDKRLTLRELAIEFATAIEA